MLWLIKFIAPQAIYDICYGNSCGANEEIKNFGFLKIFCGMEHIP